jgi:fatty acid desaturase
MAAGAAHGLSFRLPARRDDALESGRDRRFELWRTAIWSSALVGTAALATTALNAIPGTPVDEIVMASAYTLTGILGHVAPLSE